MTSIYISGALKGSRDLESARSLYEWAASVVRQSGYDAYLPHKITDPVTAAPVSASEVYETDVAAMRAAGAVISFLNEPSLGVGAEIALCMQESIPLLALIEEGRDVSRFVLGCIEKGNGSFRFYKDLDSASKVIGDFLHDFSLAKYLILSETNAVRRSMSPRTIVGAYPPDR